MFNIFNSINIDVQNFSQFLLGLNGLFASQDHEFIETIATRIIEIDVELKEDVYKTYNEYLEERFV